MSDVQAPTDNLVDIEIDGVALKAPKGSMIIEAADKAGIAIPRFCYHKKLSIAANCRMCLVDVEKAPKPLPACATPVMGGEKIYTQSKRAISAQQNVMEFLLINHPLDCPICDQGGECELQDVSMGYGRSISRYTEQKRVVKDENLGSLISTDMTRCIHCTRCVRFLDEVGGTNELGGIGRGDRTAISTFIGRSIDSELSGNIIDLCPVGALTNKPFRFSARAWELRSNASVAAHDSVGSNLYYHTRRGRILRSVPRDNEAVNENWLSDRDRWGYMGLYANDRASQPMIKHNGTWYSCDWAEALEKAGDILKTVAADKLGVLLSPKASNEELYLAQKLFRSIGCENLDHRIHQRDFADQASQPLHPQLGMPLQQLSKADAVLLVGSNIRHEQPIIGHKVRQAWRAGAKIFALNPVDYDFHFDAESLLASPALMEQTLAAACKALGVSTDGPMKSQINAAKVTDFVKKLIEELKASQNGVLLFGKTASYSGNASRLRALSRLLADALDLTYCEPPAEANGAGAWALGAIPHRQCGGQASAATGLNASEMLEKNLSVYCLYDVEPVDLGWSSEQLAQAENVIYIGAYVSDAIKRTASVILPLAVGPETDGSMINADGITQNYTAGATAPGDARAGWKILRVLGNLLESKGFDYTRIEQVRDEISEQLTQHTVDSDELVVSALRTSDGLELVTEMPIYGGDGQVRRSQPLQQTVHRESASVRISPETAQSLELSDGQAVRLLAAEIEYEFALSVDSKVAPGIVRIPLTTVHLPNVTSVRLEAMS